ncbi:polysaccharide biosynthesis/export family protein, partial [Pseudoduganella sp. RAF53_2]|uniref:polysaccharide biosynthesis/export family protein n=1 Tax=Pseudoduganella sp. RAF53_2 TaxID=3233060 RepID=UPI003F99128A
MKRLMMWVMAVLLGLSFGIAQAADVTLGPGDVVKASVYDNPDMAIETRISDSGRMTFPLLG